MLVSSWPRTVMADDRRVLVRQVGEENGGRYLKISSTTTLSELQAEAQEKLLGSCRSDLCTIAVFNCDGAELLEEDFPLIRDNDILYIGSGDKFKAAEPWKDRLDTFMTVHRKQQMDRSNFVTCRSKSSHIHSKSFDHDSDFEEDEKKCAKLPWTKKLAKKHKNDTSTHLNTAEKKKILVSVGVMDYSKRYKKLVVVQKTRGGGIHNIYIRRNLSYHLLLDTVRSTLLSVNPRLQLNNCTIIDSSRLEICSRFDGRQLFTVNDYLEKIGKSDKPSRVTFYAVSKLDYEEWKMEMERSDAIHNRQADVKPMDLNLGLESTSAQHHSPAVIIVPDDSEKMLVLDDVEFERILQKPTFSNETDHTECGEDSKKDDLSSPSLLIGSSEERKRLREQIEHNLAESEKADWEKEKQRNETEKQRKLELDVNRRKVVEDAERLEKARERRESRVQPEPEKGEQHQSVIVRHLKLRPIKRKFHPNCSVLAVYDWVGSLCAEPEHFCLETAPNEVVYPDEKVSQITQMLFMREQDDPIPLSKDDSRVSLGVGRDNHEVIPVDDALSQMEFLPQIASSPQSAWPTADSEMPQAFMAGDDMPEEETMNEHFTTLKVKRSLALDLLRAEKCITVKRCNVLQELMQIYKDPNIVSYNLLAQFEEETGTGDGVLREIYSLFWEQFFSQHCQGDTQFSLLITPRITPDDFIIIGRIIHHQYLLTGIFPVRLAQASVQHALFDTVSEECLIESLEFLIPPRQRNLLRQAMVGGQPFPVEEVLDLLQDFGVSQMPSQKNIRALVLGAAKAEFLTKPFLAWLRIRQGMGEFWGTVTRDEVGALYRLSNPTARAVVASLEGIAADDKEESVTRWLKRYLMESGDKIAAKFVRFVTATDVLLPQQVMMIRFELMPDLAVRPKSRTCFGVLILPKNYISYSQLQENFDMYLRDPSIWDLAD